jgi:hypothetical protein
VDGAAPSLKSTVAPFVKADALPTAAVAVVAPAWRDAERGQSIETINATIAA